MKTTALFSVLLLWAAPACAQAISWPSDLSKSLEGPWVNERDATAIEIKNGEIFLTHQSQFADLAKHQAAVDAKIGSLGARDEARDSDYNHFFKGKCWDSGGGSPYFYDCAMYVNKVMVAGKEQTILSFNGGLFHREAELSEWGKKHRLRANAND